MILSVKCRNDGWYNKEFFTIDIEHMCITHNYIERGEVRTAEQFEMPTGSEFSEPLIMAFEVQFDDTGAEKSAFAFNTSLKQTTRLQSVYAVTTYDEFLSLWKDKLWNPDGLWHFIYYGEKCLVSGVIDADDLDDIKSFLNKVMNAKQGGQSSRGLSDLNLF